MVPRGVGYQEGEGEAGPGAVGAWKFRVWISGAEEFNPPRMGFGTCAVGRMLYCSVRQAEVGEQGLKAAYAQQIWCGGRGQHASVQERTSLALSCDLHQGATHVYSSAGQKVGHELA